ncbi:HAD-IIB family hydrolase [Modestobacter sp. I12A-02628]|uniref:HAD family phosphatase n=1 Tax=Goekera deserti TaxID=2497753 RepID=A0A7K3WHV9_9ACTN|nr:HAD-IIB family hydrolase [Goekera deserti]NDI48479.1 HAD-IIB family hydrolase [Goekera deserti]NEL56081.1 HAD family phosphatase [Goekera deserti]
MGDWRPRLIASDMDGTLLRSDDTVSERTRAELAHWRAERVPVVIATGRPPRWMLGIREVLGTGTAICANGAITLDLATLRVLGEHSLQPDVLRTVTGELRRRQPDTWFAVEYGDQFRHEPVYQPRWDVDAPGVAEATLPEMVAQPVAKLLARHERLSRDAFVELVAEVVDGRATVTHSSTDALAEISALGVTKATGLAEVSAAHGLGAGDVVFFGDMPNDLAAFAWVRDGGGHAVAMANAHPDVLAAATHVTDTNDADGVAKYLAQLR